MLDINRKTADQSPLEAAFNAGTKEFGDELEKLADKDYIDMLDYIDVLIEKKRCSAINEPIKNRMVS